MLFFADDVRSLALPGTYHEKVTHLGNALLSFCRLKHLDLSRNALQSLDGLKHLGMLEKINLYLFVVDNSCCVTKSNE